MRAVDIQGAGGQEPLPPSVSHRTAVGRYKEDAAALLRGRHLGALCLLDGEKGGGTLRRDLARHPSATALAPISLAAYIDNGLVVHRATALDNNTNARASLGRKRQRRAGRHLQIQEAEEGQGAELNGHAVDGPGEKPDSPRHGRPSPLALAGHKC